ncbi:unnamed protein product [Ilex paraguariensis]|uniref:BTB domain-containing protein n=1 Tax=Ilex paraguariensis TaxID=185542 RepID=A0ABC8RCD1_9AQUA
MGSPIATTTTVYGGATPHDFFSTSFSKFNSALTAGLLNPMSPPQSIDKTRSSTTLFEMMASELDVHPRTTQISTQTPVLSAPKPSQVPPLDKQSLMQQRLINVLACRSPGNQFNDSNSSDMKLTLSSKDGLSVCINVHRQILVGHSRFFSVKLSERWGKQQRISTPYIVEIADCDDIEVYIETLRLMYCEDLRKKLMKEDVSRVLGILKPQQPVSKIQTQPTKPNRRRLRETTITTTPVATTITFDSSIAYLTYNHHQTPKLDPPTVVSPDNSWCCPASKPSPPIPPPPLSSIAPLQPPKRTLNSRTHFSFCRCYHHLRQHPR